MAQPAGISSRARPGEAGDAEPVVFGRCLGEQRGRAVGVAVGDEAPVDQRAARGVERAPEPAPVAPGLGHQAVLLGRV